MRSKTAYAPAIQSTRHRCRGTDGVEPLQTERMRALPRAPNVSKVRGRKTACLIIKTAGQNRGQNRGKNRGVKTGVKTG